MTDKIKSVLGSEINLTEVQSGYVLDPETGTWAPRKKEITFYLGDKIIIDGEIHEYIGNRPGPFTPDGVQLYMPIFKLYEEKNKMKEEFKIDKLGWYLNGFGNKKEIICIKKDPAGFIIVQTETTTYSYDGRFFLNTDKRSEFDLIKYLGPELPKEPRKFEFEAYIFEDPHSLVFCTDPEYALDKNFGYPVSPFCVLDKSKHSSYNYKENIIKSKWKVTMTEVLE